MSSLRKSARTHCLCPTYLQIRTLCSTWRFFVAKKSCGKNNTTVRAKVRGAKNSVWCWYGWWSPCKENVCKNNDDFPWRFVAKHIYVSQANPIWKTCSRTQESCSSTKQRVWLELDMLSIIIPTYKPCLDMLRELNSHFYSYIQVVIISTE